MLPGMMRSGAWTRFTRLPASAITGRTDLSMVPGEIVDSITTVAPSGQTESTCLTAATT